MQDNDRPLKTSRPRSLLFLFAWNNLVAIVWWSLNTKTGGSFNSTGWPPGSTVIALLFATAWLAILAKPQRPLGFLLSELHIVATLLFTGVIIARTLPWLENLSQPENFGALFAFVYWIIAIPPAIAALTCAFALHRISKHHP